MIEITTRASTLNTIKQTVFYSGLIIFLSLFHGCSGHTLQDLIGGDADAGIQTNETKSVSPSQNKALNSISPSRAASDDHEEHRHMQKNISTWIDNEWDPLTEDNATIQKTEKLEYASDDNITVKDNNQTSSGDNNDSFTLQHYVDKAGVYFDNKERRDANKTKAPSHVDKVNAMPGIGKSDKKR